MDTRTRDEIGPDRWDTVVRESDDGWVYTLYGWQRLILGVAEWGFKDLSFAVVENGRPVAVVPLQFDPASRLLGSSAWGGAGPTIVRGRAPAERERLLRLIFDRCREIGDELNAAGLEIWSVAVTAAALANRWGVNPLHLLGFEDRSGISQVIDLRQDPGVLWSGVSKNARWTIRNAMKQGFEVREVAWADYLDAYYETHRETYLRTGVTPHPFAYFRGLAEETAPKGHSVLFAAFDADGTPVAFHNDARFGVGVLYHTGCSRSEVLKSGVNYLLQWEAIKAAQGAGFSWYEVGPIFPLTDDPKQRGLTVFKTRFGGDAHRHFRSYLPFAVPGPQATRGRPGSRRLASRILRRTFGNLRIADGTAR